MIKAQLLLTLYSYKSSTYFQYIVTAVLASRSEFNNPLTRLQYVVDIYVYCICSARCRHVESRSTSQKYSQLCICTYMYQLSAMYICTYYIYTHILVVRKVHIYIIYTQTYKHIAMYIYVRGTVVRGKWYYHSQFSERCLPGCLPRHDNNLPPTHTKRVYQYQQYYQQRIINIYLRIYTTPYQK